jgi:monofunctional glycosyltransferase
MERLLLRSFAFVMIAVLGAGCVLAFMGFAGVAFGILNPVMTPNMVLTRLSGTAIDKRYVPLSDISPHLIRAVIAAEDTRFCAHHGIDWDAVSAALEKRRSGQRAGGASGITQQTAKNLFLWNGGSWFRKALETPLALWIDLLWSKPRVMEHYLNIAEWGDGLYGAEAAAQRRFGKAAKDLTQRESALLASVLPSPNTWRVDPPGPYVRKRVGTVEARMRVVRRDHLDACVIDRD